MQIRAFSAITPAIVLSLALCAAASSQDAPPVQPSGVQPSQGRGPGRGPEGGPGQRGGFGMPGMGGGRGLSGVVTAVAADHYTIKTDAGETYTVAFSVNTRMMKQQVQRQAPGQPAQAGGPDTAPMAPPVQLKPGDIKVGDTVVAIGQLDQAAKTVGALMVLQIDPERARQMREIQANYGKTWLQGKVTAINGVSVTLLGMVDNAAHTFVADEDTTFRKRRDPITLADVQVGDMIRVEGALKDGIFVAASVNVMGTPSVVRANPASPDAVQVPR